LGNESSRNTILFKARGPVVELKRVLGERRTL